MTLTHIQEKMPLNGREYTVQNLNTLEKEGIARVSSLPFAARVLIENLARHAGNGVGHQRAQQIPAVDEEPGDRRGALAGTGALITMLEIAAMLGLPFLATVFLTSLRGAAGTPWTMLQADPWN